MRRRAEPCRTFLVTTHMYVRMHTHARGIRSQGNRFGRFGRFGKVPQASSDQTGNGRAGWHLRVSAPRRTTLAHVRTLGEERILMPLRTPTHKRETGRFDATAKMAYIRTQVCF